MDFDAEVFTKKLNRYFSGEISSKDLGKWANMAYYDILKGGYIETRKIVIYPFLKKVSTFHVEENDIEDVSPCSKEDVEKVRDILNGIIDFDFNIEMSVPLLVNNMLKERQYFHADRRELFLKLRREIVQYIEQKVKIRDAELLQIENIISNPSLDETVLGILESHILKLLKYAFANNPVDTYDKEHTNFKLYAQKSNNNLVFERLINYIDSYIGYRNFHLFVSFREGIQHLFVLV